MTRPFYPLPLSLFPVACLLALNLAQLSAARLLHPLVVLPLFALLLMGLGRLLLGSWDRAAWAACLVLLAIYPEMMAMPVILGAAVLAFWRPRNVQTLHAVETLHATSLRGAQNMVLNIIAVILLAVPVTFILAGLTGRVPPHAPYTVNAEDPACPDVYFIVLDSYTSHAVLLDRFGYDNTPFLYALAGLGFVTGDCSAAYDTTEWSLASTLNVQTLHATSLPSADELWKLVQHPAVRTRLEAQGYRTLAFETGFDFSEWRDADTFISAQAGTSPAPTLNDFDWYTLTQTLPGQIPAVRRALLAGWSQDYRARTLHALAELGNGGARYISPPPEARYISPPPEAPVFVFAHILAPHPPFVFQADGAPAAGYLLRSPGMDSASPEYTPEIYAAGYIGQVAYIDAVLPGVLGQILQYSRNDPVIVLQGDHGAWYAGEADKLAILCAVHAPAGLDVPLEPEETFKFVMEER